MKWREVAFYIIVGYNFDGKPISCLTYLDFNQASMALSTSNYQVMSRLFLVQVDKEDDTLVHTTLVAEKP